MFERFTDRARRAVVWAQEEARAYGHLEIEIEHLLVGVLREEKGVAGKVMTEFAMPTLTLDLAREHVAQCGFVTADRSPNHIGFTRPAKKVLELALREALSLGHNYIGTEHLLLALVRHNDSSAASMLTAHGFGDLTKVRQYVRFIHDNPAPSKADVDALRQSATITEIHTLLRSASSDMQTRVLAMLHEEQPAPVDDEG